MKKHIYTLTLILFGMNFLIAQDSSTEIFSSGDLSVAKDTTKRTRTLSLSGSIDAYYRTNFTGDFDIAPGTSFANLPGFALGMANLIVAQEGKRCGFTVDLVFGPRGEDATFLSSVLRPGGNSSIVNQLYVYWNATDALTFTIGNFNTFLGYEVISPADNFNYSTSYMFSYGPFSHTGLKGELALNGGFSIMAGIFNPTDATEYNPAGDYTGAVQLGYENGGLGIWLNGLFSDGFSQFDVTAGYDVTDRIYFGLNATVASDNFNGLAGYFQVAMSDELKLGIRAESFTDKGLGLFEEGEKVFDITLSANYQVGNLTLIPEFRLDTFDSKIVSDGTDFSDSLSSFVLAVVYGF